MTTETTTTEITGVTIRESMGSYQPFIEIRDWVTGRTSICGYDSPAALESGLSNPRHWAHAVYRTTRQFCLDHQDELQGDA